MPPNAPRGYGLDGSGDAIASTDVVLFTLEKN